MADNLSINKEDKTMAVKNSIIVICTGTINKDGSLVEMIDNVEFIRTEIREYIGKKFIREFKGMHQRNERTKEHMLAHHMINMVTDTIDGKSGCDIVEKSWDLVMNHNAVLGLFSLYSPSHNESKLKPEGYVNVDTGLTVDGFKITRPFH